MLAIDGEVPVDGDHGGFVVKLRQANEAGIGERHRPIAVARDQPPHGREFRLQLEADGERADGDQLEKRRLAVRRSAEQMPGLGEDRFTGERRRRDRGKRAPRPVMMMIARAEEGHQRPRIRDAPPHHLPKPAR
ncbi:MAG: hypothetical protein A3F77_06735 [Betaproteobacteria bacterium RIFCSPLOWO2_12_FULL_67_28]|nr:MAG: hypothetical protein A3F77_06735 [Betaproteobacteria bacterium RIFCSPLOWO2_12_FULL_67_28]